jgi:hypothetical protein
VTATVTATVTAPLRPRPGRAAAATPLVDVTAPLVVYYALHAAGVADVVALALGAVPPAVKAVVTGVRGRRVDPVGALVLLALLLATVASLISGDPRELLVRNALLSLPFGLWTLATFRRPRPLCFRVTRDLLPHKAELMDELWARDPRFRRAWLSITVVWGATMLADTALRVLMAWTLPVSVVPALDTALTAATLVALQVPTHLLLRRSGTWHLLFRSHRRDHHVHDHR